MSALDEELTIAQKVLIKHITRRTLQLRKLSKDERRKKCAEIFKKKYRSKHKLEIPKNELQELKTDIIYEKDSVVKPYATLYNLIYPQYVKKYKELSDNFDNKVNNFTFQYEEESNWYDISDIDLSQLLKLYFVKNNKICRNKHDMVISTQFNNTTYQFSMNEYDKLIQKNTTTGTEREIRIKEETDKKSFMKKYMYYDKPICKIEKEDYFKLMKEFASLFREQFINQEHGYNRAAIVGGQGGQIIANLATQFSKAGNGYKYDRNKCQLWIKPLLTQLILQSCYFHDYDQISIVTHGSDSAKYNLMAQDPTGFKIEKSEDGAKGYGIYCALDDNVSKFFNKMQPEGCFIICLLFQKSYMKSACEFYSYNNNKYIDSVNTRDPMILFPFGLAVAK